MLKHKLPATSNFEASDMDIVKSKVATIHTMQKVKPITNIEETQKIDRALLIQLAKLLERLPNIED
jgi:hypothetical protein